MLDVTPQQRKNLYDLALWLDKHHEDLIEPNLLHDFTMGMYGNILPTGYEYNVHSTGHCGTAGCAIGWATWAIEPRDVRHMKLQPTDTRPGAYYYEEWPNYASRLFGVNDRDTREGRFMFAAEWADWPEENTPRAAANRILMVLELNAAPAQHPHWNVSFVQVAEPDGEPEQVC